MNETLVTVVSAQTSRKVFGMATAAMTSGATAMNVPKTKASTSSAPRPPIKTSTSTLGPLVPSLLLSGTMPVMCSGTPPTVTPLSAPCTAVSDGDGPKPVGAVEAGVEISTKVVRPSCEMNALSCIERYETMRASGSADETRSMAAPSCCCTCGDWTVMTEGSDATSTSG